MPANQPGLWCARPEVLPRTARSFGHNLAQCETGSCGDAYDCGKQALRNPPLGSSATWPVSSNGPSILKRRREGVSRHQLSGWRD
jgi:hypothetical protein